MPTGGLLLHDPIDRLVLLSDPSGSVADKIVALAGGQHQDILLHLEEQQAATMVQAYKDARQVIGDRLNTIWSNTFGAGAHPEAKDVIEWARGQELVSAIDAHLEALGITTQALQGQAWSAGAQLGMQHANIELGFAADDFGIIGRTFGNLNTLVPDLGMAAAMNETQHLADDLKVAVHGELTQGAVLGEGINQIQRRVDGVLGGETVNGQNRAELISRWATIKGYNAAADQAINDAAKIIDGLMEMWLCEEDERLCPDCLAHMGETVTPDAEFDSSRTFSSGAAPEPYGGFLEYPPLHPRCRCTITAWHERWADTAEFTPQALQEGAQQFAADAGLAPKSFPPPTAPEVGSLRATRAGRQVLRAQNIASIPEGVRKATLNKFLNCWAGGG